MDPALFDLLWEVYKEVDGKKPIYVVSAYRSPKTNEMLRSRSKAVAKNSRHTQGMAMDFYIPGIKLSKLRATAMKKQIGGVGYYPSSGSPFVHLDTGSVRAWPRMTRTQLARIFPKGRTLHLPSSGATISAKGRKYAAAQWQKCKRVPCGSGTIAFASSSSSPKGAPTKSLTGKKTLLEFLGFEDNSTDNSAKQADTSAPRTRTVATAKIISPKPLLRPQTLVAVNIASLSPDNLFASAGAEAAGESETLPPVPLSPNPPPKPQRILLATRDTLRKSLSGDIDPTNDTNLTLNLDSLPETELPVVLAALDPIALRLRPTQLSGQPLKRFSGNAAIDAASALVADASTVIAALTPEQQPRALLAFAPATNGNSSTFDEIDKILANATPSAIAATPTLRPTLMPRARPTFSQFASIQTRAGMFIAPDLDHVIETMADGYTFDSARYAILWHPDTLALDAAADMGTDTLKVKFSSSPDTLFQAKHFQLRLVNIASR